MNQTRIVVNSIIRRYEKPVDTAAVKTCIYCGKSIPLAQLFSARAVPAYIIPFSCTLLYTQQNMLLTHTDCLQAKENRSPFEAFGSNPQGYNWKEIHNRASPFNIRKRSLFTASAAEQYGESTLLNTDTLADTSFLARKTAQYLCAVCQIKDITAVSGILPSLMYKIWKLHTVLGKQTSGTPADYRYHCLNALITGLADNTLYKTRENLMRTYGCIRISNCRRYNAAGETCRQSEKSSGFL